jgi:hypothetical protein
LSTQYYLYFRFLSAQGERQIASKLMLDAAWEGTSVRDLYLYVLMPEGGVA